MAYRERKEADPANWPPGLNYSYSLKTSTTSLRRHLEKNHLELYRQLAKEKQWKTLLPSLRSQQPSASENEQPDAFNEKTFQQYLVNFVVADDQVFSCLCLRFSLH